MKKRKANELVFTGIVKLDESEEITQSTGIYKDVVEPEFVKLYLDCLFTVRGIRKGINSIFLAFLEYMSYADSDNELGGQIIYVNKAMKMAVAKKLGLGLDSINKGLSELSTHGIFKRVALGTYQVNPKIVGRGEWKDIKNIRATFDFAKKDVVAEIIRESDVAY